MLLNGFTQSLTGLEKITAAGWPYRGTMITSEVRDYSSATLANIESATIGQPALENAYIRLQGAHYPIKQINAPTGWDYWFMHSRLRQAVTFTGSPSVRKQTSGDQLGVWCKNPDRHFLANEPPFLELGAPLKVGDQVIRVSCFATDTAGELLVSLSGRSGYVALSYPVEPVDDVYYAIGYVSSTDRPFGLRSYQEIAAMPVRAWRFSSRIHGFYENKILISIGVDPFAATTSSNSGYITNNSLTSSQGSTYRTPRTDYTQNHGWQPFLFLELIVNGLADEDISLAVVHGWAATAGILSRSSGADCGQPEGECFIESHQTNTVLDVFYGASGQVQTVFGDFDFTCESHRYGFNPPPSKHFYYSLINYKLKHRLNGASRELSYSREVVYQNRSDGPGKMYTYKEVLNGETLVDDTRLRDWGDSNTQVFTRPPLAGSEIRCITMPWSYYYIENPETFESEMFMTPARTFMSKTGRNCVSLYASQDSSTGQDALKNPVNTKTVSHWSVCHNSGFKDMPGFSAIVSPDNDDWRAPSAASIDLFGYAGNKTQAPVNPVTGAVDAAPTNRPVSWVHYL